MDLKIESIKDFHLFVQISCSNLSVLDEKFLKGIYGMLIGDKGYISAEKTVDLKKMGIKLITKPRKNMRKLPVDKKAAKAILKRYKIETSFSLLKQQFLLISRFVRSFKSFLSQIIFFNCCLFNAKS